METQKSRWKYHVFFILILFCIAALLEGVVSFYFDELRRQPVIINRFLKIYPIYNRDGTWLHGKIGIGYISWLLHLEAMLSLLLLAIMVRYMEVLICFFGLSDRWLFLIDIGMVPAFYRMFTRIRGTYTLDYLQINQMVYDFPDFCIGVFVIGILIWAICLSLVSRKYIREKRNGRSFAERMIWSVRFRRMLFQVFFLPKAQWQEKFEQWEENQE